MPDVSRPRRILVVDDDRGIRDLLRALLEAEGYEIAEAAALGEALAAVAETPPDLAISDLRLPDAEPAALLDHLAADTRTARIPVLVCSGAMRELERIAGRSEPRRVATLLKPFDIDELLALVARLLDRD